MFHPLPPPTDDDIFNIAYRIVRRTFARLQRVADEDELETGDMGELLAASAQPSLPWVPSWLRHRPRAKRKRSALVDGYSVHAGGTIHENDRASLERVLRYGARPPIAQDRLSYDGHEVRYRLRKPSLDGQTELRFTPTEFLRRLSILVPPPRRHLTRYHGVLAPRSRLRVSAPAHAMETNGHSAPTPARRRMAWAELMKRVFEIDVTRCSACGGKVKVIAQIQDRHSITKILAHLGLPTAPPTRAPPRLPEPNFFEYESPEFDRDSTAPDFPQ